MVGGFLYCAALKWLIELAPSHPYPSTKQLYTNSSCIQRRMLGISIYQLFVVQPASSRFFLLALFVLHI